MKKYSNLSSANFKPPVHPLSSSTKSSFTPSIADSRSSMLTSARYSNPGNAGSPLQQLPNDPQQLGSSSYYRQKVASLNKQIADMQSREQRLLDKLRRLQEGLQKQHTESMKLQQLYNGLLDSYKLKEQQIRQLELRYREYESQKCKRGDPNDSQEHANQYSDQTPDPNTYFQLYQQENAFRVELQKQVESLTRELQIKNLTVATYGQLPSKSPMHNQPTGFHHNLLESIHSLQKELDNTTTLNSRLTYECQYLRNRNKDLEITRGEQERIISCKNYEIQRLRQQKISLLKSRSEQHLKSSTSISSVSMDERGIIIENKQLRKDVEFFKQQAEEHRSHIQELNDIIDLQQQKMLEYEGLLEKAEKKLHQRALDMDSNNQSNRHSSREYPGPFNPANGGPNDFFSFSKEQQGSNGNCSRQVQNTRQDSSTLIREDRGEWTQTGRQSKRGNNIECEEEDLPPFPKELQIQSLIRNIEKKQHSHNFTHQEGDSRKWEVVEDIVNSANSSY